MFACRNSNIVVNGELFVISKFEGSGLKQYFPPFFQACLIRIPKHSFCQMCRPDPAAFPAAFYGGWIRLSDIETLPQQDFDPVTCWYALATIDFSPINLLTIGSLKIMQMLIGAL